MKEIINNVNWKKVKINAIKISFIVILNTALWVYLIGSFVPYAKIGEFRLSWIDYLKLSDKVEWYHIWFLYLAIGIGIVLTISFIKWWIEASRRERDKQELINAQEQNTAKILEELSKKEQEKKEKKENKNVEKYL